MRRSSNARHGTSPRPNSAAARAGLARALSKLGYCSRSNAAELIRAGQVKLNGVIRRDPETPVRLGVDKLEVDGAEVRAAAKMYLMLNKPRGVVTTACDEQGRETVYNYLPDSRRPASGPTSASDSGSRTLWLAPVGRLDKASEGLLLLTNDSEWAARVTAPETHLDKTYHVQIAAIPDQALLSSVKAGVTHNGDHLCMKEAKILRQGEKNSWLELTLDEGKNRQIRRIFDALGLEVLRLIRVSIGQLHLGDLPKGGTRALTPAEKSTLADAMKQVMDRRNHL
jgi:23S rRNA pseudouridine2605 synthase